MPTPAVASTAAPGHPPPLRVLISCGEASGDLYAGALMRALQAGGPVEASGLGGGHLASAGATLIEDYRGLSVTGLTEAVSVLRRSWQTLRSLDDAARRIRPDVFVAIDFPDFNFRLLPRMRRLKVPIVYYVSPQIWAWRPARMHTLRQYVDRMLVIFPFESELYERAGVPCEFVGHPLVDLARPSRSKAEVLAAAGLHTERPTVALLPGSRANEVGRLLSSLVEAARLMQSTVPSLQFVIARAPSLDDSLFEPARAAAQAGLPLAVLERSADDVLAAADAAVTASGTATVQAALHGTPLVVVYRLSRPSFLLARAFVKVRAAAMVNLVAGRHIVAELIQQDCTATRIAEEVLPLVTDPSRAAAMRRDLADVRARLGGPGASARAAAAIRRVAESAHAP